MAANYIVRFGAYHRVRETFAEFVDALACYRAHENDKPEGASMFGANHDDESDGLTQEERDEVIG